MSDPRLLMTCTGAWVHKTKPPLAPSVWSVAYIVCYAEQSLVAREFDTSKLIAIRQRRSERINKLNPQLNLMHCYGHDGMRLAPSSSESTMMAWCHAHWPPWWLLLLVNLSRMPNPTLINILSSASVSSMRVQKLLIKQQGTTFSTIQRIRCKA